MSVKMDMKALETVMEQIHGGTSLADTDPYVVAAAVSCSDATYDRLMLGSAQFSEAQCCIVAWCRLFRCAERRVGGADVAFAMSAFSIPAIDAALCALDSFNECPQGRDVDAIYQVLRAVVGLSPKRASVTELAAERMRQVCAKTLADDVEPCNA